jgi:hypothetical protein
VLVSPEILLQANATVIAEALILLTLPFFGIGYSEQENRSRIYYYTATIIIPLAISSALILLAKQGQSRLYLTAILVSFAGFIDIASSIGCLAFINSPLVGKENIAIQSAVEPERFNITNPAKCANFFPGSLAELCAFNPEKFNVKLEECLKLIPEG